MTFSGGMKGMMLEAAERHGLSFPALAPETLAKVGEVLGVGTSLGNPLDAGFTALSSAEAYFKCIEILRADPNIDVLLLQEELPPQPRTNNKVDNLLQVDRMVAESPRPPVAIVSMISYMFTEHTREFRARLEHLPVLQEIDKALKAAGAAGRYGALRAQAASTAPETARTSQAEHRGRAQAPQQGGRRLLRAQRGGFEGAAPRLRHPHAARGDRRQRRHRHHGGAGHRLSGGAEAPRRRGAAQVRHRRRHARHPQRQRNARGLHAARAELRQGAGPAPSSSR